MLYHIKVLTDDGVFHNLASSMSVLEGLETLFNSFDEDVDVEAKIMDVQLVNYDKEARIYD